MDRPALELEDGDQICRYLHHNSQFSFANQRIKHAGFLPKSTESSLSAADITGLTELEVWALGKNTLGQGRTEVKARGDLSVATIRKHGLDAVRDNRGWARHTSITGWPKDSDENRCKAARKEIALRLSEAAVLHCPR